MSLLSRFSNSRELVVSSPVIHTQLSPEERGALENALHRAFATKDRNPEPQHAVLVNVDNSFSMRGTAIDELNRAIQEEFVPTVQDDPLIARSVVIGLAGFSRSGKRAIEILHPFSPPAAFRPPLIKAGTSTPHCQRLCEAISLLAALSEGMRKAFDIPVRHGWLFDFTDGQAGDLHLHNAAMNASRVLAPGNNIECFYFGVGPDADLDYLRTLEQPGREARLLRNAGDFLQFFSWLYKSIRMKSQSMAGEEIELPDITGGDKPFRTSA